MAKKRKSKSVISKVSRKAGAQIPKKTKSGTRRAARRPTFT